MTLDPPCVIQPRGADLILTGEIDLHNVAVIESHILPWLHDGDNHLDLSGVEFMDSTGLTLILRVHAMAIRRGARLHITCSPVVYTVLSMAGLLESFPALTVTRAEGR